MSSTSFTAPLSAIAGLLVVSAITSASAQEQRRGAATPPPLQMCLATAADFSSVYPTDLFLHGVRSVSCVFTIPPDVDATKVSSKWIAIDVGEAARPETELAANEFTKESDDRTGRLRYMQDNPLPKGEYLLAVFLDDEPWETKTFHVVDPPRHPPLDSAAELVPLNANEWLSYDVTMWGPAFARTRPGAASLPPDHTLHSHLLSLVGRAEEHGTPINYYLNGEHAFTIWKKALDKGVGITAAQSVGGPVIPYDPPAILCPFPPESYMSWRETREAGAHGPAETSDNELWGPLPLLDGRAHGYVLLMRKQSDEGAELTTELHIVPGTGIVRQKRVEGRAGVLIEAHDWALEPRVDVLPNEQLRGRFGRLVVKADAQTWTSVFSAAKPDERIQRQSGSIETELLPGRYFAEVSNARVGPFEVVSQHDTVIRCGTLTVHAGDATWSSLYHAGSQKRIDRFGGTKTFTLPIGPYEIEVAGQREIVIIRSGKESEF